MTEIQTKVQGYLDSQIGQDIKTLIAYTIRKTGTLKDDEILDNIDDVVELIANEINEIADVSPSDEDAKDAGLRLAEEIVKLTPTKWDDFIVGVAKRFM